MKQDRLYFLGNLLGGIAKGALNLGKKLVSKIKEKRARKVNKAAEKLAKQKARLLEAENLIAETGSSGAGVSGYGKLLNVLQGDKLKNINNDQDLFTSSEFEDAKAKFAASQSGGNGADKQALKWGLIGLGIFLALKALRIIR